MRRARTAAVLAVLLVLPWLFAAAGRLGAQEQPAGEQSVRFAVLGHLYPIRKRPALRKRVLEAVNAAQPDLVFVLGDSDAWEQAIVDEYRSVFEAPVHFAPGNHDVRDVRRRAAYLEAVGALQSVVEHPACTFVLIDSSAAVDMVREHLTTGLDGAPAGRPSIVLSHHRIWDDTKRDVEPYGHDQSYPFSALAPTLAGRVRAIFSGDSIRGRFPKNSTAAYWCEQVEGIDCYACGSGDGVPATTFVVAELAGERLTVTPHRVLAPEGGDAPAKPRQQLPDASPSLTERVLLFLTRPHLWIGLLLGLVIGWITWARRARRP